MRTQVLYLLGGCLLYFLGYLVGNRRWQEYLFEKLKQGRWIGVSEYTEYARYAGEKTLNDPENMFADLNKKHLEGL